MAPVNPEDEAAIRTIRRPLLQEIILWEFGSDFRQRPELGEMLEKIERTLDADARARKRLARLVRQLQT